MVDLIDDEGNGATTTPQGPTITTRGYQREMLEESLRRNIIIAMDTGSGKTHIAVLRLKAEAERETRKISWFFAPTVALCEQQARVIKEALPVSVLLITGAKQPDQWKDTVLWGTVLNEYRVVISTPQVLLDALRHGYIVMGRDISLLIFDEAHHTVEGDPYNRIMQEFYHPTPPRKRLADGSMPDYVQPMVMGLTASPIYGGNVDRAFSMIEKNLDCTIVSPRAHRDELNRFVHRPHFRHITYRSTDPNELFSPNLAALDMAIENLNIEDDPYVQSLRAALAKAPPGSVEYRRVDSKLSKVISKEDSFAHRGLKDCQRTAKVILADVGYWAAEWFVWEVLENAKKAAHPLQHMMKTWKVQEKVYLLKIINSIHIIRPSYAPEDVCNGLSDKVIVLIEALLHEKEESEQHDEAFSGLVFVQRRDVVLALKEVLSNHPAVATQFRIGSLLGTSESSYRHSMMDITRQMVKESPDEVLMDFRIGLKNLIVSTSVAEEGIDVQACGCVIRWDLPPNMASWAQSRGRARKQRSTFVLMFDETTPFEQEIAKWRRLEEEMVAKYTDSMRQPNFDGFPDDDDLRFEVPETGALLTLDSAIPHLAHFCAVSSSRDLVENRATYDLDPPEYPLGWHAFTPAFQTLPSFQGPWNSTVNLPRSLPPELRTFSTDRAYSNKISAHQHAAFKAYRCLYEAELLNNNLLPRFDDDSEVKKLNEEIEKRMGLVDVQKQVDPWVNSNVIRGWYTSELKIGDLPPLYLFTQVEPPAWSGPDTPILYLPRNDQIRVQLRRLSVPVDDLVIAKAREYTKMIFWSFHGSRMDWGKDDFSYLFLPVNKSNDQWSARRVWAQTATTGSPTFDANAGLFGEQFNHPEDITLVKRNAGASKGYRFIRWRFSEEFITDEEEEIMRRMYRDKELEITFPLLVVEAYPPRTNFLIPPPPNAKAKSMEPPKRLLLIAELSLITVLSPTELQYASLLPSIFRAMFMSLTIDSFRNTLFSKTPLINMSTTLLTTALTAPVSQERVNYQRLETLGDAILKYVVAIQVFDEHPLWPEGYLTKRKDHIVCNARLATESFNKKTFKWIIRDRLLGKKWKPAYLSAPPTPPESPAPAPSQPVVSSDPLPPGNQQPKPKQKKKPQEMSTKVLADVIESLIGAAYEYGGIEMAYEVMKFFELGFPWKPIPDRISSVLARVEENTSTSTLPQIPVQVKHVQQIIGYTFKRPLLLVEALTHPSHQEDLGTVSYERLEFLGDAVLDMIVNDYIYHAPGKEYSPGHVYLRKVAVVNGHILAFFCLHASLLLNAHAPEPGEDGVISLIEDNKVVYLWQCMLHSSLVVHEEQRTTHARYHKRGAEIASALESGMIYPWASLTRLQAPKFFADLIESILGAVYLDTGGNLDAVRDVMRSLGLMQVLERIVHEGVDTLHPVSRLSIWAGKQQKKVKYDYVKGSGNITCNIYLDDELVEGASETDVYHGKPTQEEVRLASAEAAIQILDLRA